MSKLYLGTLLAGLSLLFWSLDRQERDGAQRLVEPDSVFLKVAASSSLMEVELGKLAQQKGVSARVKETGAMMVRDHTKANQELMQVAARLGFQIPQELLQKHRRHVAHLDQLSGAEFDRSYARMLVAAHREDVDEFEDHAKKAADASVRAFAAQQLPLLQAHLKHAQELRAMLRPDQKSGGTGNPGNIRAAGDTTRSR